MASSFRLLRTAIFDLLDESAAITALLSRPGNNARPFADGTIAGPMPVLLVAFITGQNEWLQTKSAQVQITAMGPDPDQCDEAVELAKAALTNPAFLTKGLDVSPDPRGSPLWTWSTDQELNTPAESRSDITLTFLTNG